MPPHAIDWAEAAVHDGTLHAPVAPAPGKAWRTTAKAVVAELRNASSQWPAVRVKKAGLEMDDVGPLNPQEVRFFLEGVVQQANTAEPPETEAADDPDAALTEVYVRFQAPSEPS